MRENCALVLNLNSVARFMPIIDVGDVLVEIQIRESSGPIDKACAMEALPPFGVGGASSSPVESVAFCLLKKLL